VNHPPVRMSPEAEALWRRVYEKARRMWVGNLDEYEDHDAMLTANAAVATWYTRDRGRWSRRALDQKLGRMPEPGTLFLLGRFKGIDTVTATGDIVTHAFDPGPGETLPALLWSQDLAACFVFPFMRLGDCTLKIPAREGKLVAMWNKGRPAVCAAPAEHPRNSVLGRPQPALTTSYSSDKFTHGSMREYIHHHDAGVMLYASSEPVPRVLMLRGGRLRVTPDGLEG